MASFFFLCGLINFMITMYYVKWDSEVNSILLTDIETNLIPPRPVFFEELDLLGFDKYWNYPKSNNPLLWAIGRRYFYKGILAATAKKADALNLPDLVFEEGYENLYLEEIDIEEIIDRNKEALFILENDAIDFIEHICTKYAEYPFSVSFSGGKDSQAVLDLVTRVIHSDDITIIFSDTTLEHQYTYDTVKETIDQYKEKYPNLKFETATPIKPANEFFKEMGLPSRFHRWCTPILKTAPYNKLIKNIIDVDSKIIVFEGVRTEESPRRSKYKQIADGVKHQSVINTRPILYWNFSEVILYNLYRNLPVNPLYRYGLLRVGCELCPFSSEWSDCIHAHIDNKFEEDYVPLIKEYAKNRGLTSEKDLNDSVSKGHWKKRAGGKGVDCDSAVNFSQTLKSFKAISINPCTDFLEWVKILGSVSYYEEDNLINGELSLNNKHVSFSLVNKDNKEIIEFFDIQGDTKLQTKLKKILRKSTFCVHCGICDVECNTGALETTPNVHIDSNLCDNCENCINLNGHGCFRAKSVDVGSGGKTMKKRTSGIDKYSSFGLREQWLEEFLDFSEEWLDNNSLGPKQIPAVKNWLSEANLIEGKNEITQLTKDLKIIYKEDPYFVWGVIWVNLYYNSKIINWYCDTINWGAKTSKTELLDELMDSFPDFSKGTLNNPLSAMINMFDNSPLNDAFNLGNLTKKGRAVKFVSKDGVDSEIDIFLVAYALYKLKETKSRLDFTVPELYDEKFEGGPYKLFGISQSQLERVLRGLQQSNNKIINVDLAKDLDNIFLDNNVDVEDIIRFKKECLN